MTAVSVDDGKVLATFAVGGEPEGVDLRPDGRAVYVTSEEDSHVAVIDVPSLKLLTTIKVGPAAAVHGLPARQLARLRQLGERRIGGRDRRQTHKVLQTIQLSGELTRPMGVVAAPDGKRVFVSTGRGKNVVVIDTATNMPTASIEVGDRPWGIAVSRRRQDGVHRQRPVERHLDCGRGRGAGARARDGGPASLGHRVRAMRRPGDDEYGAYYGAYVVARARDRHRGGAGNAGGLIDRWPARVAARQGNRGLRTRASGRCAS